MGHPLLCLLVNKQADKLKNNSDGELKHVLGGFSWINGSESTFHELKSIKYNCEFKSG